MENVVMETDISCVTDALDRKFESTCLMRN
jgi:hypothetical protein